MVQGRGGGYGFCDDEIQAFRLKSLSAKKPYNGGGRKGGGGNFGTSFMNEPLRN